MANENSRQQNAKKALREKPTRGEIHGGAEKSDRPGGHHRLHEKEQAALVWTCGQKGGVRLGEENLECLGCRW